MCRGNAGRPARQLKGGVFTGGPGRPGTDGQALHEEGAGGLAVRTPDGQLERKKECPTH